MSEPIAQINAALEGRYSIERQIGEGGMATVFLADDLRHDRKVALKVLKPELAAIVGADRFLAEIKTTADLQHPNILVSVSPDDERFLMARGAGSEDAGSRFRFMLVNNFFEVLRQRAPE